MPSGYVCLNAANLCPSPARVIEAVLRRHALGRSRSVFADRQKQHEGRDDDAKRSPLTCASTPEETSSPAQRASRTTSSRAGSIRSRRRVAADLSQPSEHRRMASEGRALRFTRPVSSIRSSRIPARSTPSDAFRRQLTPRTRDRRRHPRDGRPERPDAGSPSRPSWRGTAPCPSWTARGLQRARRPSRRAQPEFYSGSAHKWRRAAEGERRLLRQPARARSPSSRASMSLLSGDVGISLTMEGFWAADEPADDRDCERRAGDSVEGRPPRARASFARAGPLIEGCGASRRQIWTTPIPPVRHRRLLVHRLDARGCTSALSGDDCFATRGTDRGGLRFSRTDSEPAATSIERVAAVGSSMTASEEDPSLLLERALQLSVPGTPALWRSSHTDSVNQWHRWRTPRNPKVAPLAGC